MARRAAVGIGTLRKPSWNVGLGAGAVSWCCAASSSAPPSSPCRSVGSVVGSVSAPPLFIPLSLGPSAPAPSALVPVVSSSPSALVPVGSSSPSALVPVASSSPPPSARRRRRRCASPRCACRGATPTARRARTCAYVGTPSATPRVHGCFVDRCVGWTVGCDTGWRVFAAVGMGTLRKPSWKVGWGAACPGAAPRRRPRRRRGAVGRPVLPSSGVHGSEGSPPSPQRLRGARTWQGRDVEDGTGDGVICPPGCPRCCRHPACTAPRGRRRRRSGWRLLVRGLGSRR